MQVRLIHEQFGAVGGSDEPTPEGKQPVQASAATPDEKQQRQDPDQQLDEIERLIDEAEKGYALADKLTERMTRENTARAQAMHLVASHEAGGKVMNANQKLNNWQSTLTASALKREDPLAEWKGADQRRFERAEALRKRLAAFGSFAAFGGFDNQRQIEVMNRFNARQGELFPEYSAPPVEGASRP